MANTIFGRANNNKVNTKELYALHCTFSQNIRLNPVTLMMAHIQNLVAREGTTPFCIGGIVTAIAVHLNWGERIQLLPPLPAVFMDIDNCRAGRLIKVREAGGYYLMVKNARVHSVIMPNHNRTYLGNPDNWLYNLNAPEPGENVQGNQGQANNAAADEIEEELERHEPQQQ